MGEVGALIWLLIGRAANLGWWWAVGCAIIVFLIYFVVVLRFGTEADGQESE